MAVLWDMGILPDLQVLPEPPWWESNLLPSREEAIEDVLESGWVMERDMAVARETISQNFDRLFAFDGEGYRPQWRQPSRELLITWLTG